MIHRASRTDGQIRFYSISRDWLAGELGMPVYGQSTFCLIRRLQLFMNKKQTAATPKVMESLLSISSNGGG